MLRASLASCAAARRTVLTTAQRSFAAAAPGAAGSPKERELEATITRALGADFVRAIDISGGCGALFRIEVVSPQFEGKSLLQQHKLVNEAIATEIGAMHGLTLQTSPTSKWRARRAAAEQAPASS